MDARRKTLFQGKTFIFATGDQMQKFAEAIKYASGRCVHADERIFGTMRVDDATSDNFVIVVPARGTQPASKFKRMAEVAKRKGLHLIPDSHIGTAIIKASREYDCNPRRKPVIASSQRVSQSASSQQRASAARELAPETQTMRKSLMPPPASQPVRIPDTLPKTQKSSAGSSVEDENAETMLLDSVKKEEPPSQDEEELRQGNVLSSVSYISILVFMLHDLKNPCDLALFAGQTSVKCCILIS